MFLHWEEGIVVGVVLLVRFQDFSLVLALYELVSLSLSFEADTCLTCSSDIPSKGRHIIRGVACGIAFAVLDSFVERFNLYVTDSGIDGLGSALEATVLALPSVLLAIRDAIFLRNRARNQDKFVQGCASFFVGVVLEREALAPLATVLQLPEVRETHLLIYRPVVWVPVFGIAVKGG